MTNNKKLTKLSFLKGNEKISDFGCRKDAVEPHLDKTSYKTINDNSSFVGDSSKLVDMKFTIDSFVKISDDLKKDDVENVKDSAVVEKKDVQKSDNTSANYLKFIEKIKEKRGRQ